MFVKPAIGSAGIAAGLIFVVAIVLAAGPAMPGASGRTQQAAVTRV